ncbi:hypothetical protein OJ253_1952 [Cryptosporidium canis]|uniref:Uncharacterized protein n=1 Tax=Cryptosporidium canis TaxID=195482 RepID=A0A9D5DH34_9CRYT|nr:hypothetical protein OJ253_1952 [Cryptosporidium canis]
MIQLILARTVSSLCNCVTFFSGGSRSAGQNFHYRGFNKTRNDQTEYEIDSLLMEDDLVDELVATPLSAEEIAAKLSNPGNKGALVASKLGEREAGLEGNSLVRGADIWMSGGGAVSMGIGGRMGARSERTENKISNDWWSDGDEDDDYYDHSSSNAAGCGDGGFVGGREGGLGSGSGQISEKIINATFFGGSTGPTAIGVSGVGDSARNVENDLYFDENVEELCFQGNDSCNNQLQKDSWDRDFLGNYRDEQSLGFGAVQGGQESFPVPTDLRIGDKREEEEEKGDEIIFGGPRDSVDYTGARDYLSGDSEQIYTGELESRGPPQTASYHSDHHFMRDDFEDFKSGISPGHGPVSDQAEEDHTEEAQDRRFLDSKMAFGLGKGSSFDQETDDISLREGSDYMNEQTLPVQSTGHLMDDFCDFGSPKKEENFAYIHQDPSDLPGLEANAHPATEQKHILETDAAVTGGFTNGNLLDDFDDIFNSSFASAGQPADQSHQPNLSNTYGDDDDFGMFDFISAKSPQTSTQHHAQHQPSIILD